MPTIRQAEPTDIPELVRLRTRFLAELRHGAGGPDGRASAGDEPSPAELASAALLEESTAAYYGRALPAGQFVGWLAEEAGEVVGMAGVFYFERPPMERPPMISFFPPSRSPRLCTTAVKQAWSFGMRSGAREPFSR